MNIDKVKKYSIATAIIFIITYILASFIEASFLLPHGGRFGVVIATVFAMIVYIVATENIG